MQKIRSWIKSLYAWTTKWAQKKNAEYALAGLTAAEGIFFPIPTDPLLMAMTFIKPRKWFRYAMITLISSIVGGMIGYLVGWGLFESVGQWIIDAFHLQEGYVELGREFDENAAAAVFIAAVSFVPYKLITLTAGAFQINFPIFVIASIVGRGSRFILVALLANQLGKKYKEQIEKYIDIIGLVMAAALIIILLISNS